jgi:putative membrane protein
MTLRWLLASLHLLALGIGLGAVWVRGRSLRAALDAAGLRTVFQADAWWGFAAFLWIGTGLWRLLAGLEKHTEYYFQNHLFLTKMALLVMILALEVRPIIALTAWRRISAAGRQPDTSRAPALARISFIQAALVVLMVFLATAMARGLGVVSQSH